MKKLKLDLDDLQVDSFETVAVPGKAAEGTVYGHATQPWEQSCGRISCVQTQCVFPCTASIVPVSCFRCTT